MSWLIDCLIDWLMDSFHSSILPSRHSCIRFIPFVSLHFISFHFIHRSSTVERENREQIYNSMGHPHFLPSSSLLIGTLKRVPCSGKRQYTISPKLRCATWGQVDPPLETSPVCLGERPAWVMPMVPVPSLSTWNHSWGFNAKGSAEDIEKKSRRIDACSTSTTEIKYLLLNLNHRRMPQ